VLEGHGAEVISVGSAVEALTEMERQVPNVLVSDIGMPGMDGFALISKIRQLPAERGGRIPAAALTAYARVEDRTRLLSAGYQLHIPKPVEPSELTAIVASLAKRYTVPLAI
jgi:CheY-like chemotaxis protein